MWRILLIALLLAGCVQLPPTPEDIQAKTFQSLPDKAVIYVVRAPMDSFEMSGLSLDDGAPIMTHRGTYYRWEVAPGLHRVAGFAAANESVVLTTEAGKIYFLEHTVIGNPPVPPRPASFVGRPRLGQEPVSPFPVNVIWPPRRPRAHPSVPAAPPPAPRVPPE